MVAPEVSNRTALAALGEPRRAEIVRLLIDQQLCVRDIVSATGLAQPLVSHHLKVLREAHLVEGRTHSNLTVYRVRAETLSLLAQRLTEMARRAEVTGQADVTSAVAARPHLRATGS